MREAGKKGIFGRRTMRIHGSSCLNSAKWTQFVRSCSFPCMMNCLSPIQMWTMSRGLKDPRIYRKDWFFKSIKRQSWSKIISLLSSAILLYQDQGEQCSLRSSLSLNPLRIESLDSQVTQQVALHQQNLSPPEKQRDHQLRRVHCS